jgi:UDP-4-amino-4,6-dideoxy-N-acetyl-beta-L-altrosamine transaminase
VIVERFLGYGRQSIDRADIDAVVSVLCSDFLTQGPVVERFEAALAERCGARFAVAVSSGTAALHLACLAAGIGPGDIGLTSAMTFAASANCLLYAGGDAVFVDIDREALGMSAVELARVLALTPHAKTIIPVHFGGLAHTAADIRKVAQGRVVIEDAAHSLGGAYPGGKPVGCCAFSDMTIFSFHPVKAITTGEGGVVLTNNIEFARVLRMLRSHGIERDAARFIAPDAREKNGAPKPWLAEQQMLGFNYRMTDIQAALGLSQLSRLEDFVQRRRAIALRYDDGFRQLPSVRLPQSAVQDRSRSGLHLYVALFDFAALKTTRTDFIGRLAERKVGSQVHYVPVYRHPYYASRYGIAGNGFPQAEDYYDRCLSLPLHPDLTDEEVERVVAAVTDAVGA